MPNSAKFCTTTPLPLAPKGEDAGASADRKKSCALFVISNDRRHSSNPKDDSVSASSVHTNPLNISTVTASGQQFGMVTKAAICFKTISLADAKAVSATAEAEFSRGTT